jgi:hypothetical protein
MGSLAWKRNKRLLNYSRKETIQTICEKKVHLRELPPNCVQLRAQERWRRRHLHAFLGNFGALRGGKMAFFLGVRPRFVVFSPALLAADPGLDGVEILVEHYQVGLESRFDFADVGDVEGARLIPGAGLD